MFLPSPRVLEPDRALRRLVAQGRRQGRFSKLCVEVNGTDISTPSSSDYYVLVAYPVQKIMVQLPSQCFVASCILWCDWERWQFRQAFGSFLDPRSGDASWRHHRPGPHLRWENVIVKTLGDHWKRNAASAGWKSQRGVFRVQAYKLFGLRPF